MHLRTLLLGLLAATGLGMAADPVRALAATAHAATAESGRTPAGDAALGHGSGPGSLQLAERPLQPFLAGGLPGLAVPAPEAPAPRGPRLPLAPRLRFSPSHAHACALTCNRRHRELSPVLRRSRLHAPAFSSGTPPPACDA